MSPYVCYTYNQGLVQKPTLNAAILSSRENKPTLGFIAQVGRRLVTNHNVRFYMAILEMRLMI